MIKHLALFGAVSALALALGSPALAVPGGTPPPAPTDAFGHVGVTQYDASGNPLDLSIPAAVNLTQINGSAAPSLATAANQTASLTPATPAAATATQGALAGCQDNTAPPTFSDGQQGAVQCDTKGSLNVVLRAAGSTSTPSIVALANGLGGTSFVLRVGNTPLLVTSDGTTIRGVDIKGAIAAQGGSGGGGVDAVEQYGSSFTNITTATTTTVKSGAGILHELDIGLCVAAATITLYDSLTASGTKIGTYTCPATVADVSPKYHNIAFSTGLTINTSANTDVTPIWR